MYLYVSFLRPPPQRAPPTGFISITPQIANDLRTELCDTAQDIYYIWSGPNSNSPSGPSHNSSGPSPRIKLTTWRPSSAYKELRVPLPRGACAGQSWRLGLTCTMGCAVDLTGDSLSAPLPVFSMPILLGAGAVGKQEQVERIYTLPLLGDEDVPQIVRIREQTSFDLDKKVWDSGVGLSSWLCDAHRKRADTQAVADSGELTRVLFSHDASNVLELGAGTGIVSITLAALRSSTVPQNLTIKDRIITTDLPSAMPLLQHNISANRTLFSNGAPEALVLDWDDELPASFRAIDSLSLDLIIMADVTYNTASFPALIRTLARLTNVGTKSPLILLGYKERDAAERTLWDLSREIGVSFSRIGERTGAGGAPVEIWLGRVNEGREI